jgi:hypothetical protein
LPEKVGKGRPEWEIDIHGLGVEFEGIIPPVWENVAVRVTRRRLSLTIQVEARQPDVVLENGQ